MRRRGRDWTSDSRCPPRLPVFLANAATASELFVRSRRHSAARAAAAANLIDAYTRLRFVSVGGELHFSTSLGLLH